LTVPDSGLPVAEVGVHVPVPIVTAHVIDTEPTLAGAASVTEAVPGPVPPLVTLIV
jgi:hypothetical protein